MLDALENGTEVKSADNKTFRVGVDALPDFPKDATDRNRTSPFAFTGNKFEFRMLGSSDSISCTNTILNTIVAEELSLIADKLEGSANFREDLMSVLVDIIKEHKQIIYNGNGYSEEWLNEAVNVRGLPNLVSTVDALPEYVSPKSIALFEKFHIYTAAELRSRTDILLDNYSKVINIEALTMIDIVRKKILPAVLRYSREICETGIAKQSLGIPADVEKDIASELSGLTEGIYKETNDLEEKVAEAQKLPSGLDSARFYRDEVFPQMQSLRATVDEAEVNVSDDVWPLVPYTTLLFSV